MVETTVWTVFIAALITAITTGLGAAPFLFVKEMSHRWLGISNGIAAGLMLGASYGLINEGLNEGLWRVSAGIVLGMVFMVVTHRLLEGHDDLHIGAMQGADALKSLLIMGAMTLHSFAEGVGVGVSYGGGETLGGLITTAIAVHNIPEGLAISLVLIPRGVPVWRASLWSIFSSLPQPLMAIPAFLFVTAFRPVLPVGLGIAAGAMIWMVFVELVPDALDEAPTNTVAVTITLAVTAMLIFQGLLGA